MRVGALCRGQLALRKLYHESERLVVVLYTSPTCGPCRTLKPIFSKVADEYSGKVLFFSAEFSSCEAYQSLRYASMPAGRVTVPASVNT